MCTYEDADKVRAALHDGSLRAIEGAVFKVCAIKIKIIIRRKM